MWRRGVRAFSSTTLSAPRHNNVKEHGPFIGKINKKYADIVKRHAGGLVSFRGDPNRPSRALSPYLMWVGKRMKESTGLFEAKTAADVMKDLSGEWKTVSESEKEELQKVQARKQEEYKEALTEYETSDRHLDYTERLVEAARSMRYPEDPRKPKRPPSAYMLFLHEGGFEADTEAQKDTPAAPTQLNPFLNRIKASSERWKTMSTEDREPYENRADLLRKKHQEEMAKYHTSREYQDHCDKRTEWSRARDKFVKKKVRLLKGMKVYSFLDEKGVTRDELQGLTLEDLGSVDSAQIRSAVEDILQKSESDRAKILQQQDDPSGDGDEEKEAAAQS